ncbi:MAG: hypothetical protein ACK4TC_07535 [Sphingomonas pseudosanguinis]|uniref:hypothetical protein n=1 Tax=Sphingomonas pseudosanguinis TaxID=413712 RepID=UPI00391BFB7D
MSRARVIAVAGGLLLFVALIAVAYIAGRRDGRAIADGKQAAVDRAVAAERGKREAAVAKGDAAGQARETDRQTHVREITRETNTITERPVYRNVCVDADGVRILDRAAAVANGDDPRPSAGGAGEPAQAAPGG